MRAALALLLVPCAVAVLAHEPALDNGFTNWDDPEYVLANPLAMDPLQRGLGGLLLAREEIGYPMPIPIVGYALQRRAFASADRFGLDARGFHAVSIALHLFVVALLALLARRLGANWAAAAAAATLFAAHPLTVEPVAWVVGQKDLLATGFTLAALLIRAGPRGDSRIGGAFTGALVALALACKPSAVAAPAMVVLLDLCLGRSLRRRRALFLYGAMFALAAADTWAAIGGHEARGVSTTGLFGTDSLAQAGWAMSLQLRHAVWPADLTARYFAPPAPWLAIACGVGVLSAVLIAAAARLAFRREARAVCFGIGAALIAYLPVAGLLPLPRGPADSYMYLPLAMAAIALARGLSRAMTSTEGIERIGLAALFAAALAAAAVASREQAEVWRNSTALWAHTAAEYPDDPRAVSRLGDAFLFEREPERAVPLYEAVSQAHPTYAAHLGNWADALMLLGRPAEAEPLYARFAREIGSRDARETYAWFLLRSGSEPSDAETAASALRALAPELAERGRRAPTVRRAAELMERYGEPALAASLRARAAELERR